MDGELRITLKDLQTCISKVIRDKEVSEAAVVLWAMNVEKNSTYDRKYGAPPGSVLFGLEWIEDGKIEHGTLKVEPPLNVSELC